MSFIALSRIFEKAGESPSSAFVPFYNLWVLAKLSGFSRWWLPLLFVPVLGIVMVLYFAYDVAAVFQRSMVFAIVLLWILPPVGLCILGFGKSRYVPPVRASATTGRIDA